MRSLLFLFFERISLIVDIVSASEQEGAAFANPVTITKYDVARPATLVMLLTMLVFVRIFDVSASLSPKSWNSGSLSFRQIAPNSTAFISRRSGL